MDVASRTTRAVTKAEVIAEYEAAAAAREEHRRAKWGSAEGMRHRFDLALSTVDWTEVKRWLDIGCGTAALFEHAERAGHRFELLAGVDLTPSMINAARRKMTRFASPTRFEVGDLEALPDDLRRFDLVTMIGVLQQCGVAPESALVAATGRLRLRGQLFLSTKCLAWERFADGTLRPDPSHSWFHPQDLEKAVRAAGLGVLALRGFLPREGRVVGLDQSHTMFLHGTRRR